MTDRGLLHPILGVISASAVLFLFNAFAGYYPNWITIANFYLVGLGIGLVIARFGRLGPFEGTLGSPWCETRIQEILGREAARALRYDRDLTIVALRPASGKKVDFERHVRVTDQLLRCRNDWNLLILPETDRASALLLLRQICPDGAVHAALVSPDRERPRHPIDTELLELLRAANRPGNIIMRGQDMPEFVPLIPVAS